MDENFLQSWNQAKQNEEQGHRFFREAKYHEAAEYHKKAAILFKEALGIINKEDKEIRERILGNYHIEIANSFHCLATEQFYKGDKTNALGYYQKAIQEQKNAIEDYEKLKKRETYQPELSLLKTTLHFYLTYENICLAQIAFLNENYPEAIEFFKIAEIHSNLEVEFILEAGDLTRSIRSRARNYYLRGQILRSEALAALQKENKQEAKGKYLLASQAFEDAAKLYPKWNEYTELAEKTRKMGAALRE